MAVSFTEFVVSDTDDLLFLAITDNPALSIHRATIPTPQDLLLLLDHFLRGRHFAHSLVLFHGSMCSMFVNSKAQTDQLRRNNLATEIAGAEFRANRETKPTATVYGPALIFGRKVLP